MAISVLHIGKTGGTALISKLKAADRNGNVGLEFHGHIMTLNQLWEKKPQRKVIFGVREPVSRYISAFNSRLRKGAPRHNTPWSQAEEIAFSFFSTPNALAEALSSENDLERAVAQFSMLGIAHVNRTYLFSLGNVDFLKENENKIKFVYLQETLNSDFECLKAMLKIDLAATLPTDDFRAHRAPDGLSKELSKKGEENIRSWYENDVSIYQYCQSLHEERIKTLGL